MALTFHYLSFVIADMERARSFYCLPGLPVPAGAHLDVFAWLPGQPT